MIDPRAALEAIGQLPDAEIDIADAALQFARVDAPEADWQAARQHLSDLAREAVALAGGVPDDDIPTRARVLALLLSARHAYAGDAEDYDNLRNANLIHVIERRRGLPVALGILWLHAARTVGWAAHGADFPGHFLLALEGGGGKTVLDVFAGGTPLDSAALRRLLRSVEGRQADLRPGLLAPMSSRAVLLRLQTNIKPRRARRRRPGRGAGLRRGHAAHRPGQFQAVARGGDAEPAARAGGCRAALLRAVPAPGAAGRGGIAHPRRHGASALAAELTVRQQRHGQPEPARPGLCPLASFARGVEHANRFTSSPALS